MTQLSQQLLKYYTRKRNRILFKEKLSLNALALKMYEELGYKQIDASVLSRVLKGKRLFTVPQLQTFCRILQLPEEDCKSLFQSLQFDYLTRKGWEGSYLLQQAQA